MLLSLATVVASTMIAGCGNRDAGRAGADRINTGGDKDTLCLPLPVVPRYADTPEKRSLYMADHYWDAADWSDTTLLKSDRFMGESMANYGVLLSNIDEKRRPGIISSLLNRHEITPTAYRALEEYAYRYFYYPGAPQYDAELYLLFVNALLGSGKSDEATTERLLHRRGEILKNRVRHQATMFEYVDANGETHRFSPGSGESELTFLILYDPECDVCAEAVDIMTSSKPFSAAIQSGDVSVYAINAYGDEKAAGKVSSRFPVSWHVGYSPDGEVEREEIYVIRSTPSIYIIDKEGIILEKDIILRRLSEIVGE